MPQSSALLRRVVTRSPASIAAIGGMVLAALLSPKASWAFPAQAAPGSATTVTLGAVSSPPKGQVMVPLFLTPGAPVGSLSALIRFDRGALTFVRAEKGFLLDGASATFRAEVRDDGSTPGQSVIELQVSTSAEAPRALREGLVLSLVFRVADSATPESTTSLRIERLTAGSPEAPPKPVAPVVARDGSVEILRQEAVPYVGCFFFTH